MNKQQDCSASVENATESGTSHTLLSIVTTPTQPVNRLHFDFDGFCYKVDLPFRPEVGDIILAKGYNKETSQTKYITVVIPENSLIYSGIDQEWKLSTRHVAEILKQLNDNIAASSLEKEEFIP